MKNRTLAIFAAVALAATGAAIGFNQAHAICGMFSCSNVSGPVWVNRVDEKLEREIRAGMLQKAFDRHAQEQCERYPYLRRCMRGN